jgi:hypothetical protein
MYNQIMDNNDGLTKEERQEQALKGIWVEECGLGYPINEKAYEEWDKKRKEAFERHAEETQEGGIFFDSEHPLLSLFASWFGNKK